MKMTVKDLIQKLLECPLNAEVHIHNYPKDSNALDWVFVAEVSGKEIVILEN